jgi:hypothetical protein
MNELVDWLSVLIEEGGLTALLICCWLVQAVTELKQEFGYGLNEVSLSITLVAASLFQECVDGGCCLGYAWWYVHPLMPLAFFLLSKTDHVPPMPYTAAGMSSRPAWFMSCVSSSASDLDNLISSQHKSSLVLSLKISC